MNEAQALDPLLYETTGTVFDYGFGHVSDRTPGGNLNIFQTQIEVDFSSAWRQAPPVRAFYDDVGSPQKSWLLYGVPRGPGERGNGFNSMASYGHLNLPD